MFDEVGLGDGLRVENPRSAKQIRRERVGVRGRLAFGLLLPPSQKTGFNSCEISTENLRNSLGRMKATDHGLRFTIHPVRGPRSVVPSPASSAFRSSTEQSRTSRRAACSCGVSAILISILLHPFPGG